MTYFITGLPYSGIEDVVESLSYSGNNAHLSELGKVVSKILGEMYGPEYRIGDAIMSFIKAYIGEKDWEGCASFDASLEWAENIPHMCEFDPDAKFICMVRNPSIIVALNEQAFRERLYSAPKSSIASRAYAYAAPDGRLGHQYAMLKDAVSMGYKKNMLFVDIDKLCKMPGAEYSRIAQFVGGPVQLGSSMNGVDYTPINPVEWIGLDLYQQYNREIFWDAWV